MQYSKFYLKLFFAAAIAILFYPSCKPRSNKTLTIEAETNEISEFPKIKQSLEQVILKYCSGNDPEDISITQKNNSILIQINHFHEDLQVERSLSHITTKNTGIQFYETYDASEIIPYMLRLNDTLAKKLQDSVFNRSNPNILQEKLNMLNDTTDYDNEKKYPLNKLINYSTSRGTPLGPIIGYCKPADLDLFFSYVNSADNTKWFPPNLKLMQGAPESGGLIPVYTIRLSRSATGAAMEGDMLQHAGKEINEYNQASVINLKFKNQYIESWRLLTKKCAGSGIAPHKAIAIVLNQIVLSAPLVYSEIGNGNAQISGNFSEREIDDFCMILNMPYMPHELKILNFDLKENEN